MIRRRLERRQYFLLRLAAILLDALLFSLALMIPGSAISVVALMAGADPSTTRTIWIGIAFTLVLSLLVRDGWRGRSPGKRILGLLVKTPGPECGVVRSIVRNLPLFIPPLLLFEVILVLMRSDSKRLGDMIARTVVMEE